MSTLSISVEWERYRILRKFNWIETITIGFFNLCNWVFAPPRSYKSKLRKFHSNALRTVKLATRTRVIYKRINKTSLNSHHARLPVAWMVLQIVMQTQLSIDCDFRLVGVKRDIVSCDNQKSTKHWQIGVITPAKIQQICDLSERCDDHRIDSIPLQMFTKLLYFVSPRDSRVWRVVIMNLKVAWWHAISPDDIDQILHFHQSKKMIFQFQFPFDP